MFHGNVSLEIANGLKELRKRIEAAKIPPSELDKTLNLATWNIREFGRKKRKPAALHYIAEVIGQFDIVSIVELRDDLSDLAQVLEYLGPTWHAVYSDIIPDAQGNMERIAFVYDERAAAFNGFASNVTSPRTKAGGALDATLVPKFQWWRAPYMAAFRAGNFDFVVITAHIQWGTPEGRLKELKSFAEWIKLKSEQPHLEDKDILITGDFNIETPEMHKALLSQRLKVPAALSKGEFGSNLAKNKRYDQILHLQEYPESFTGAGGVLDFYTGGIGELFPGMEKTAFTYQMSDHLPLWVQIDTDNDGYQLDQLIRAKKNK